MLIDGRPRDNLGWGIPSFVTEHLNPIAHIKTVAKAVVHPVDTFKAETGKAIGNVMTVARPWVGGPGGVSPNDPSISTTAAALQNAAAAAPACGFFARIIRAFGGSVNCV